MSTRAGSSNSSNSNINSNSSNNHMSSKRGGSGSRKIAESSLGSATTISTSTSVNQSQQHNVADKSAVKRKKRRKDEEEQQQQEEEKASEATAALVVERIPVVLLTRLEDEKKSNERKINSVHLSDIKVVIERTGGIESIKASSSDNLVLVGKRTTRHPVHRSCENLASSDAKALEPINDEKKKKKEVVVEESVKAPSKKKDVLAEKKVKAPSKKKEVVTEESVKAPSNKKDKVTEESVKAPSKKKDIAAEENAKAPSTKKQAVVEESAKAPSKKKQAVVEESAKAPTKKKQTVAEQSEKVVPSKKKEVVVEEAAKASSKKKEAVAKKSVKAPPQKKDVVVEESVKAPTNKKDIVLEETVKAPSKKKKVVIEESVEAPPKNETAVEENVKAPPKKKDVVVKESVKAPTNKKDVVVEESVKAPPKKKNVSVEESVKVPSKKKEVVVEDSVKPQSKKKQVMVDETVKAPSKKKDIVLEDTVKVPSKKKEVVVEDSVKPQSKKKQVVVDESVKAPLKTKDIVLEETVKAPSKKKKVVIEESVEAPPKNEAVVEESVKKVLKQRKKKEVAVVVEETVKEVLKDRKEAIVVEESVKKVVKEKKNDLVVEESVKALPKKSIVSSKKSDQTESKSSKVKIDHKEPVDSSLVEHNVHNVNNDNLNKIDPKITERQLLVRLDRSQVENYLKEKCLQRLQSEDELVIETDKNHSENQDSDALFKASKEIKTCAIPSNADDADKTEIQDKLVEQSLSVDDITNRLGEEVPQNTEEPVEIEVKKKRRSARKTKEEEEVETAKNVVKNQRLSSREKRKVKSRDIAGKSNKDDSDKDLRDDTKIDQVSSVQMNENQIEHLDKSSKDTSCESAKTNKLASRRRSLSRGKKSLNDSCSAVVNSEKKSSKKSKRDKKVVNKTIESNSMDDHAIAQDDSNTVAESVPPLPMEVDALAQDHGLVADDDSKAEDDSAQQICDIHSKSVTEINAKTLTEGAETIDESTKEICSESSSQPLVENFVDSQSSESPIENLINNSIDSECPAKNVEENETFELPSTNVVASDETTKLPADEKLVTGDDDASPTDSFVSCENAEATNDESTSSEHNVSFIETIEDTESTTSTCTLIEETPEEFSRNLDKDFETEEEDLSEKIVEQTEVDNQLVQDTRETEVVKELPQIAEKEIVESPEDDAAADSSLKVHSLDESLSQEDKIAENNEHESTFENNLKSVENLVIDSILNGEIVSPKIIAQSAASRVEEVQTFVFEGGVEDFVNDIVEVPKEASAENLEPLLPVVVEEPPVAETLEPSVVQSTDEPAAHVENAELAVSVETPISMSVETLPLPPLPTAEQTAVEEITKSLAAIEESTTNTTLASPVLVATQESTTNEIPTPMEEPIDEEFAKHRRKHTLSELKKKCTENIVNKRQAEELENARNSVNHEEPANIFTENEPLDSAQTQVAPSAVSADCFLEQTTALVTNAGYFENISDAESDICLSDRLNRISNLKIPSFEDPSLVETTSVHSEDDENSRDNTRRQRILMKITKTDANKHVTHLVESKDEEEEEAPASKEQQPTSGAAAEQVTEGEIKIIMRKESWTNSHVIKEIKIIPRTPEGGNSARIPGYSPTSSDLSSGNSSCRVPSCSPAKPDSGSYRMPGWSPASTEMGQTTMKKKGQQGRPKKYPIFTDAELIAKTTAIVNNVDVHASNLAEKPLFQPVESIRINEDDDEVETEEEHQTAITSQMCLSGSQLLDAMPAQPEVLAKYAKEIEQGEKNLEKKKKKMGRPRKKPLDEDVIGAKSTLKSTESITVGRVEYTVVDSIEEFVDEQMTNPDAEISATQTSPTKSRRGRPKRTSSQDDSAALLEKSAGEDFSMTEDETLDDDDSDDKPYSNRRVGPKPEKHLNENSQLIEDEDYHDSLEQSNEIKPRVERRGRKPWKHTKNVSTLSAEEENSMTENDDNESLFPKPKVERRGRKPWKHLKNLIALANDEASASSERPSNEHLTNDCTESENPVTEEETSMTENEGDASVIQKEAKKRGRKPWKHLKNLIAAQDGEALEQHSSNNLNDDSAMSESQVTEEETLMTENEGDTSIVQQEMRKRGRKSWKHLKNLIAAQDGESSIAPEQQQTVNDDSAFSENPQPKVERRGRKPWKHLKNLIALQVGEAPISDSALSENQVTEEETSMTENEGVNDAPVREVKKRGRRPWKHLKNLIGEIPAFQEQQPTKQLIAASPEGVVKKKMGRPRKIAVNENPIVEKTSLVIEAESVQDASFVEPTVNNQDVQREPLQDSATVVEDESVKNISAVENVIDSEEGHHQSLNQLAQDDNSVSAEPTTENEITNDNTVEAAIVDKKQGRKSLDEANNSMTEDESAADDTLEEQQSSKHLNDERILSENQITETEYSTTTENWDTDDASLVKPTEKKKRGRKPWKHLMGKPVKEKKKRGRPPKKSVYAVLESQIVEEANSITEDKSVNETLAVEPVVEKKNTNAQTEDETVSSTEDIPTVDRVVVQKKRVRFSMNISEDTSSLTEDETVSSTEDIPKVDQPVVKRKPGRPRTKVPLLGPPKKRGRPFKYILPVPNSLPYCSATDTTEDETVSSTEDIPIVERHDAQKDTVGILPSVDENTSDSLAASPIEDLSTLELMPSPKKRGKKPKLPQQDDCTFDGENSSIAASSMEDLSNVVSPKKRGRKPRVIQDDSTCSDSLAASSMEDLSGITVGLKKRGRKPRSKFQDSESLAASSVEDLSTLSSSSSPVKRKPGRPPKNRSPIKITLSKNPQNLVAADESIGEFSPVKSPMKKHKYYPATSEDDSVTPKVLEQVAASLYQSTFDNHQPAYDRRVTSLSPVKKRRPGRPPKYRRVVHTTEESQSDNFSTSEQSTTSPEKRRGRPPRRLSQDENILPSIINHDVQIEKPGRSPRRLSHDSGVLPTAVFIQNQPQQQSESEDLPAVPSLGKRQGRPPRKFSPDEEHSFSVLPHLNHDSDSSSTHVAKRQGRPPRKYSYDDGLPFSQSSTISDSDEANTAAKRRGRKPKKFIEEDEVDASLLAKKKPGRKPKIICEEILRPASHDDATIGETEGTNDKGPLTLANLLQAENKTPATIALISPPQLPLLPTAKPPQDGSTTTTISTTNLLRQQRKPKMSQPQQTQAPAVSIATPVITPVVANSVTPPPPAEAVPPAVNASVKKRGRQSKMSIFEAALQQSKKKEIQLPGNMTMEQLRQRRHSQDDSMFSSEQLPKLLKERSKEFEDAQPKKKRGRPKMRLLTGPFVIKPLTKPKPTVEMTDQAINTDDSCMKDFPRSRVGRPRRISPEKVAEPTAEEERAAGLTIADFVRTWTDRDESPGLSATRNHHRRFSQDDSAFVHGGLMRPSSRNRLRRYSQGDALEAADDNLLTSKRKRIRSSGSEDSMMMQQDEKRPRVEKELCTQHSITKELVVQLTKIEESPPPLVPTPHEHVREIVKMSLRRKLESNNNSGGGGGGGPPPLVPIEPRIQPATHSDAKLLMLMQPTPAAAAAGDEKTLLQQSHMQPAPQQFCIIFIPDALTSSESALSSKDSQPTATIVNFQPVPDSELANKSVIYTPTTTPTKIFVNEEQHNRAFLCTTCTQALDLVGRLEANVGGMTEEDKSAIKCPFCSNDFQSLFYLEYHLRQEHFKCENEKQCRHSGFNTLRIPSHDASSESEIYITFALKCRSCYELFENVLTLNEHVKVKHANLIRHKPPLAAQFSATGMVCYPPPPPAFKNGTRTEVLHCPSDCICRIGIRSTDSPMQRAQVLKRCPNFMRRLEKIEAAAYEVYTCTLCRSTFLMKDEVVEHLMKMHEVSCKFPCTKCLTSFRTVQMQENHHCSETTIRDLDKLINIVILPTDKAHDNSKFEDSSNDELGPIKTTPPPAVPSASTPLNGVKRKNGVIQKLSKYLAMQPPKKPKLDTTPTTPVTTKKRLKKTPCPKCQKKFAYRKSLNDHIIFEHIIPCKADERSKNMAVELLRLVNNGGSDAAKIEELASALGNFTDDDGVSLTKLTMINDEQENWNDAKREADKDLLQCFKCKANFKLPANSVNLSRRNNQQQQSSDSPAAQLCERCDPTRRRRNVVNNGHNANLRSSTNGEPEIQQQQHQQPQVRYTYECNLCGDSFVTTIELNRHKNDEHSNKPSEALKCDICSKVFYASRMLEKHKKMHHDDSLLSNSRNEDNENMECNNQSIGADVSKDSEANDTANSSASRRDSTDNSSGSKEEEKCNCPHCDFSAEKVSLKNHLKREHGVMAFICQFCGKLLIEISEVRHMLDYHIKSTRKNGGNVGLEKSQDDVSDLLKTLGKKRLQSLMIYHDFEGKCNNAIMRCPICPEQFATRESCRHHYQWRHDSACILCDATFSTGNVAGQHKIAVHNSIASYVWAIQRLVSAIVHSLRLDRAHPSNVLYQEVSMRLDMLEEESDDVSDGELPVVRINNAKNGTEEAIAAEPFLEPVVLSEDQLPGSGNMIEVVIGNDMVVEDSEDNLLEDFYLSPNYESSCEQPKILDAGAPIPELEEEEEVVVASTIAMATTACATIAVPTTPSLTTTTGGILIPTTPVTAETYATSAVFKLRQDNGQEEVVLAITDEDLVTYRDDIVSLAERLSATCDSLSLEEITTMLRSYFENVGGTTQQTEEVAELANAIEPRTQ